MIKDVIIHGSGAGVDDDSVTPGKGLAPVRKRELHLAETGQVVLPAIVTSAGDDAVARFAEIFTATIRNPRTRRAYFRNAVAFLRWCECQGIHDLHSIKPVVVAAYVEQLQQRYAKPSVKQQLATIRMLFDWLVTGQVLRANPAHAVRGPRHVVLKGKTPILSAEETRALLDSIPIERVIRTNADGNPLTAPGLLGLRDRAIIAAMVFTFARVGAMVAMTVEDYYAQGKRSWLRLHEKGGKQHEMPAHHYPGGVHRRLHQRGRHRGRQQRPPLPHRARHRPNPHQESPAHRRRVSDDPPEDQADRHTHQGWLPQLPGHRHHCYLEGKGSLEKAQRMACHASPRTTKLYDRTGDQISLDEVEKIVI